jgi:NAD(P)-dependent dehydrogenase (short-subunit alcohol dehydrogenase family)
MGSRLEGKIAVITGAASGIGEATAIRFVEEGARVVVADVQVDAGQAVADRLGDAARFIATDVTVEAQVAAAVDLAVDTWGRLDCMFNNAGVVGAVGPIAETTADAWARTIAVLLHSVFYGTKHAARAMIPVRSGVILSTTSVAGVIGGLGPHAYTTAKHAVVGLTKSAASELSQHGIRVNTIAPGTIPTAMTASLLMGDPHNVAAVAEHAKNTNGLGIASDPTDIANAALYLASDEARLVSGHTLVVDAGRTVNGGSARFAGAAPATLSDAGRSG